MQFGNGIEIVLSHKVGEIIGFASFSFPPLMNCHPQLPDVKWLENYCFLYLVLIFTDFRQEGKSSPPPYSKLA